MSQISHIYPEFPILQKKKISFCYHTIKTYKMSTITIDGTPITLWCLVRGTLSAFYVKIGRNNFIIDIKKLIKNKKQIDCANVDADRLALWKLKNPIKDEQI